MAAEDSEEATLEHKSVESSPQDKDFLPCNQDVLFFPVQGISINTYKDYPMSPRSTSYGQSKVHGKKVSVNGKDIALFYYRDVFYAVDEKCPHQGGPLHLGDIEDLHSGNTVCPCIVCPWHKWKFKLSSGKQVWPSERQCSVTVYPVRTTNTGHILIGFSTINPIYFTSSCEF